MASNGQQQQRRQNTALYYNPFMQNDRDGDGDEDEEFEYMDNGSTTPPTPYWMKDGDSGESDSDDSDDSDDNEEEKEKEEIIQAEPSIAAVYNPNDPLRYCLQMGLIGADEYAKWKIVNETPTTPTTTTSAKPKRPIIDYGAQYDSDSDSDDPTKEELTIVYGHGYTTQFPCQRVQPMGGFVYDPWFPNPNPDADADAASNLLIMMSQFIAPEKPEDGATATLIPRLNTAFQLKLIWERFIARCNNTARNYPPTPPPLQNFWEIHSLEIYEALQELTATHAKCFNTGARRLVLAHNTPEFHTTPLETLEHTFETIGRMCRCISDDFNTQSVVIYVEEFIHALYTELRFMEHVEAKVEELIDVEYDEYVASQSQHEHK